MAKIIIAQLPTSDSYINEVSNTELDATKGGDASGVGGVLGAAVQTVQVGLVNTNIDKSFNNNLNGNNINIGSGSAGDSYRYGYGGWYY